MNKVSWQTIREVLATGKCPADCPFLAQAQEYYPPYLGDGPECWTECTVARAEGCPVFADQEKNDD